MFRHHFWMVAIVAAADQRNLDRMPLARSRDQPLLRHATREQPIMEATTLYAAGEPIAGDPELEDDHKRPGGIAVFEAPLVFVVQAAATVIAFNIAVQTIVPLASMPETVQKALRTWAQQRVEYNLVVVSLGAFFMYAASDALSQCVEFVRAQGTGGRRSSRTGRRHIFLDLARMARSGFTSGLLSGFLAVFYFAWLDRTWQPANLLAILGQPHSDNAQRRAQWACIAGKVATDVGVYEPIYDTVYVTLQALLRGDGLSAAKHEVATKVLRVWAMAPRYWTFVDTINFSLVSLRLRPLTNALMSIPWGMYISSVANN